MYMTPIYPNWWGDDPDISVSPCTIALCLKNVLCIKKQHIIYSIFIRLLLLLILWNGHKFLLFQSFPHQPVFFLFLEVLEKNKKRQLVEEILQSPDTGDSFLTEIFSDYTCL